MQTRMSAVVAPSYAKTDTSCLEFRPRERVSQRPRTRLSPQSYFPAAGRGASGEMTDMLLGIKECYVDT